MYNCGCLFISRALRTTAKQWKCNTNSRNDISRAALKEDIWWKCYSISAGLSAQVSASPIPDTQRMPQNIQVEVRKSIPQLNYSSDFDCFSPKVPLAKIGSRLKVMAKLPLSNPYQLLSEHLLSEAPYVSVSYLLKVGMSERCEKDALLFPFLIFSNCTSRR